MAPNGKTASRRSLRNQMIVSADSQRDRSVQFANLIISALVSVIFAAIPPGALVKI